MKIPSFHRVDPRNPRLYPRPVAKPDGLKIEAVSPDQWGTARFAAVETVMDEGCLKF